MSDDKPTPETENASGVDSPAAPDTDAAAEKAAKIAAAKAAAAAKKAAAEAAPPEDPWVAKPVPPAHEDAADDEDAVALAEAEEGAVLAADRFAGAVTLTVPADRIVPICRFLKQERGYRFLVDLTAVDWPDRETGRFDVVYWMHRHADSKRLRLVATVTADVAAIDSVVPVWRGANWLEREVYDLFGIVFTGHPRLERILLWEGFNGHPLRKDFPVEGIDTGAAIYPDVYPPGGGPPQTAEEEGAEG
jgi:NADH-quinone oxidoreductase subunit C